MGDVEFPDEGLEFAGFSGETEEEVFDAEEFVFEGFLLFFGFREEDAEVVGHG